MQWADGQAAAAGAGAGAAQTATVMHSIFAGSGFSCTLTDLAPATEYVVRVEAGSPP